MELIRPLIPGDYICLAEGNECFTLNGSMDPVAIAPKKDWRIQKNNAVHFINPNYGDTGNIYKKICYIDIVDVDIPKTNELLKMNTDINTFLNKPSMPNL